MFETEQLCKTGSKPVPDLSPARTDSRSVSPSPEHRHLVRSRSAVPRSETKSKGFQSFEAASDISQCEELSVNQLSFYDYDFTHMMDTIQLMHRQHLHDKAEIKALRKEIGLMQKEFTEQRKLIQTSYHKKLKFVNEDFEKKMTNWQVEKEDLKNHYEELIEGLKADHELELQEKLDQLQVPVQTLTSHPRIQDLEEKHRHHLAEVEKRHLEEILKLKSANTQPANPALFRRKTTNATMPVMSVTGNESSEVDTLKSVNEELRRQLEEAQQQLADLQGQLISTFRKKGKRALTQTLDPGHSRSADVPEGFEEEIRTILGQINTHLENSDLFNSSCSLADSLRHLCVKFDQLSSSSFIPL